MPQINLKTLAHLGVKNNEDIKQPKKSDRCGAYAVAATLGAFGLDLNEGTFHYENSGPEKVDRHGDLEGVKTFHDRCSVIYGVTGILNTELGDEPPVDPELNQHGKNLGNSPAAMASVAKQLGMSVEIRALSGVVDQRIGKLYPGAEQRCIDAVGEAHVHKHESKYSMPEQGKAHIVLVQRDTAKSATQMHWLVQGDDGLFYDPADGTTENHWSSPVRVRDRIGEKFIFLGLWIVVGR